MPELPEVETVRRTVAEATRGLVVRSVYASTLGLHGGRRIPLAALRRALVGRAIERWERRGKHLLGVIEGGRHLLHIHLGMAGRLVVEAAGTPRAPHTHFEVALAPPGGARAEGAAARHARAKREGAAGLGARGERTDGGAGRGADRLMRLIDHRRFGRVDLLEAASFADREPFASLGPEPLSRAFSVAYLARALAGARRAVKAALLDQAVVVGVGNIYASEALFRARIDPRRLARSLAPDEVARLVAAVKATLRAAIRHAGTTFSDYRDGWGFEGRFQRFLRVYERAGLPCRACGAPIATFVQQGRSTYACPRCQR